MDWVRGGTCFPEAGGVLWTFGGFVFFATALTLGSTGFDLDLRICEGLDADGIEEEPLAEALEMAAVFGSLWMETTRPCALFGVDFLADCGFLEGIP